MPTASTRTQPSFELRGPKTVPRGLSTAVGETLPQAIHKIVQALHPERIILFGSYAYGNPTPDSDVDLLVVLRTSAPMKERSWAVSRLSIPRRFPVDIIVKTPEEIEESLAKGDFFIQELMTRGIVLYERHPCTLSDYGVRVRYPGDAPTPDEAREALEIARGVRRFARKFLGVR